MTTSGPQTFDIKPGIYKGRAIAGQEQYGESTNGKPELLLRFNVPELNRQLTAPLYFSAEAAPYSIQRLRACGWEGSDFSNLKGIDKNEVDLSIKYDPFEGKMRMKVEILSGGGTFNTGKPVDPKEWAAKVGAITGVQNSGSKSKSDKDPPF